MGASEFVCSDEKGRIAAVLITYISHRLRYSIACGSKWSRCEHRFCGARTNRRKDMGRNATRPLRILRGERSSGQYDPAVLRLSGSGKTEGCATGLLFGLQASNPAWMT
jgi:hypothetical protein